MTAGAGAGDGGAAMALILNFVLLKHVLGIVGPGLG